VFIPKGFTGGLILDVFILDELEEGFGRISSERCGETRSRVWPMRNGASRFMLYYLMGVNRPNG
jgi:hypothetical protein